MGLFHVAYNGYVWKALFLYRHPERSRGIFLAHWYSAVCEIAENGKPSAKEARKRGVQGRFLAALEMTVWCIASYVRQRKMGKPFCERSKKRRSARKISRYARNDGMVYIVLFETAEKGKPFAKGARKSRVQGRFLAVLEMTVWGNGSIPHST